MKKQGESQKTKQRRCRNKKIKKNVSITFQTALNQRR